MSALAALNPIRLIGMAREDNVRSKLPAAIKEIDIHRKELQNIKIRLEERRKSLFEVTVKAFQQNDKSKAGVYAAEHAEVRKVIKVVEASELALTQVILRLQSITDIGDVIAHISQAFKVTRRVSREVAGLVPSLDSASRHINETLSETMFDIGEVSPNINLDVRTDSREELIEQAKRLAEQRADEMQQSLDLTPQIISHELQEVGHGTPLLASGDEESYPEDNYDATLGVIYSAPKEVKHEDDVLKYATANNGSVDVPNASNSLGIAPDEVEHAMLKLLSEGRVRLVKVAEGST